MPKSLREGTEGTRGQFWALLVAPRLRGVDKGRVVEGLGGEGGLVFEALPKARPGFDTEFHAGSSCDSSLAQVGLLRAVSQGSGLPIWVSL